MVTDKIYDILVPIDFSEHSLNALQSAIRIASENDANIHLIEVSKKSGISKRRFRRDSTCSNRHMSRLNILGEVIKASHRLQCYTKSIVGPVPLSIVKYAHVKKINLIVVGMKKSSSAVTHLFCKSEIDTIIDKSECPVLTIPRNKSVTGFNKILFPIRANAGAMLKCLFLKVFKNIDSSTIKLLLLLENHDEFHDKPLRHLVKSIYASLKSASVDVFGSVEFDTNYSNAVIRTSNCMNADLIVITGDSEISRKYEFSKRYQHNILKHSKVPVLNIKVRNG